MTKIGTVRVTVTYTCGTTCPRARPEDRALASISDIEGERVAGVGEESYQTRRPADPQPCPAQASHRCHPRRCKVAQR